ncbi:SAV_2336 N-terminal domain-related protein [Streptomyces sp. NPDC059850]|uniref:SAV_2336 N-terminal domain-related protein n=1 Tax=Streptomyces sp. NPDC059850 TaxID=3346970 RepID=UPI0036498B53
MTDITEALALARRCSGDEDLTVREVAELLWLAGQITPARPPAAAPPDPPPGDQPAPPPAPPAPPPPGAQPPGEPAAAPEPPPPPPDSPTPLHTPDAAAADGSGDGGGTPGGRGEPGTRAKALPVRRPPALPRRLELARALRPLKRRVRAPGRRILDEPLTADRSARARRPVPALCHACERWLELALVVDDSVSMSVWRRTVDDFRELVEGHGAFRDVRLWRFDADDPALVLRYGTAGEDGADQAAEGRNPAELHDPSGRRLILVLTDGVGDLWGTPDMTATVREWARRSPLAVVQMLPPDLWHRTWLPPVRAELRATGPARLTVRPEGPAAVHAGAAADLAPLVTLDPEWLRPWAQALSGSRTTWRPGTAVDLGREPWYGRPEAAADAAHRLPDDTAAPERVEEFRTWATTEALNLAYLLSAAPLTLPLMRWLQQHLLPATGPAHLAEVFLSDLLVRAAARRRGEDPDQVVYAFRDGVRDELAPGLTRTDAYQVLTTLIQAPEALAVPFGGSLDFRVLAADPRGPLELAGGRAFATVAASVLGGLGGELAPYAARIHAALIGGHPAGSGGAADGPVFVECARVGGRDVAVTTSGGELWIWDLATGHGRLVTHRGAFGITALACATTASGRSLAVTLSADGALAATDLGAAVDQAPEGGPNVWEWVFRGDITQIRPPVLACHELMGQQVVAVLAPGGINLLDLDSGASFLPTVPVAERVSALALLTDGGRSHLLTGDTEGVVRGRVLESAEVVVGGGEAPTGAARPPGRRHVLSFGFGAAADPSLEPACRGLAEAFEEFGCRTRLAMDVTAREFRRTVEETSAGLTDADALIVHVAGQSAESGTLFRSLPTDQTRGRRLMIADDCPAVRNALVPVFGFDAVLISGPPERAPAWDLTLALAASLRHFAAGRTRRARYEQFISFGDVLDLAHELTDGRTSNSVVLSQRDNDDFLPNPRYRPSLLPLLDQGPAEPPETPALRQLTHWIDNRSGGGLALVTGEPWSGKTTLLAALATRMRRLPGRPTPVAVSAAGRDAAELTRAVAREITVPGAPVPGTPDQLVTWLQQLTVPPVIVVDALDEAREPEAVVAGLLRPLLDSAACRLVVATRSGRAMFTLMGSEQHTRIALTPSPELQHRTLREMCDRVLATAPAYRAASAAPVREAFGEAAARVLVERSPVAEQVLIARAYAGFIASRGEPLEDPEDARWVGSGVPRTSADVVALLLADARNPWTVPVLTTLAAAGNDALTDTEIQRRCGPPSLYEVREALAPVRGLLDSLTDGRDRTLYRLAASSVAAQILEAQGLDPACEPTPRRLWSKPVVLGSCPGPGRVTAMAAEARPAPALYFMGSGTRPLMRASVAPGVAAPLAVPVAQGPYQPLPQLRFIDWRGQRALLRGSRQYCTVWLLNGSAHVEVGVPEGLGPIEAFTATMTADGRPLAVAVNEKGAPRAWHLDDRTPAGQPFTPVPRVLGVHGFGHGQHNPTELSHQWLLALRDGAERIGHTGSSAPFDVRVAYYGGALRTTGGKTDNGDSGNGGNGNGNGRGRLRRLADALVRAVGMPNALLPGMGRELYVYLHDPAQRAQARHIVAEAIAARRPDVVIAHSLGCLVAYEALCERPDLSVDLLVTLGAPFGLDLVFNRLEPAPVDGRGQRPPGVRRWVNLAGTDDPLAAPRDLTERFEGVSVNIQCEGLGLDTVRTQGYSYLHSVELATVLSEHLGRGDRRDK